jgi:hypothetical protein
MYDGGPLDGVGFGEVDVGDTVDEVEVVVSVGDRLNGRLSELLGAGGGGLSCRPLNSAPDKCIVFESNECKGERFPTRRDECGPTMAVWQKLVFNRTFQMLWNRLMIVSRNATKRAWTYQGRRNRAGYSYQP